MINQPNSWRIYRRLRIKYLKDFTVFKKNEIWKRFRRRKINMKKSQLSDSWPFNLLKESFGIFAQILIYLKNYSIFEKKRTELCAFSQFKIYPGHGKRVVKSDLRVSLFAFTKELLFLTPQFLTVIFFLSKDRHFLKRKMSSIIRLQT